MSLSNTVVKSSGKVRGGFGFSVKIKSRGGFGLVEAMVAAILVLVTMLAVVSMLQFATLSAVKSREQQIGARLIETIFSKSKSVDYFLIFPVNSSISNYGFLGINPPKNNYNFGSGGVVTSTYPYIGVLNMMQAACRRGGFSHFTIETTFMRRDTSDANNNGLTGDLIAFADADSNLIDDNDPAIRYFNQNSDNDYYDTYVQSGRRISEEPDTHIKLVTVKLFKKNAMIAQQSELISLEQLSGIESTASGSALTLNIIQPPNDSVIFNLDASQRSNAYNLAISKSYPSLQTYRADTSWPLRVSGTATPASTVRFYVNDTSTMRDSVVADSAGSFDFQSPWITAALAEGANTVWARAVKGTNYSPWSKKNIVLDLAVPSLSSSTPSGVIKDRTPLVGAYFSDTGVSTTVVGGICPSVITLKCNAQAVPHSYDASTGWAVWISTDSSYPVFSTGAYTMTAEFGDNAFYKKISTWTFSVSIDDPDNSAPVIAQKTPIGATHDRYPTIGAKVFDNQSGIIPSSIVMKLNGQTVVDSSNIVNYYNPQTGYIVYLNPEPFAYGSYNTLELSVSHWATSPADKITSADSWGFNVIE